MSEPGCDVACVVHVHSVHSDGSGTVAEIAAAAGLAGAGAVLLTDHDTMAGRREAGWHDDVLVCVGVEVSPSYGNHYLAFGIDEPIEHTGLTTTEIVEAVRDAGGFGFAAHPFSLGGWMLGLRGRAAPWSDMRAPGDGIEVWSLVTDTLEYLRSPLRLLRFARNPDSVLTDPPARNLAAWDDVCRERRTVALGGLDAHQFGIRVGMGVRVRTMSYERSFRVLRTHVVLDSPLTGEDGTADTAAVYAALSGGRAYIARDSLADATGFQFGAADGGPRMGDEVTLEGAVVLRAAAPHDAWMTLLRDGEPVAEARGVALEHVVGVGQPGSYRVQARLRHKGRWRTWVLSNPIFLR